MIKNKEFTDQNVYVQLHIMIFENGGGNVGSDAILMQKRCNTSG